MLYATPEQLSALGSFVAREWGDYGYRITQIESASFVLIAQVIASDGSRFAVLADRWGNTGYVNGHQVEDITTDRMVQDLANEMSRKAIEP